MLPAGLITILGASVLCFTSLYVPQPILPVLGRAFGVSQADAAMLVGISMIPMAIAPIVYGYFLQKVAARRLLLASLLVMSLSQFAFAFAPGFEIALFCRLLLGLALPGAITALMTLCSVGVPLEKVRRTMGFYIAATILGGFLGRVLGGWMTTVFGWPAPFLAVGSLLFMSFVLLLRSGFSSRTQFVRPDFHLLARTLSNRFYLFSYLTIFCVFVVFAGILNNLSYRLEAIEPGISSAAVSLLYLGYLVGIVVAIGSSRLSAMLGGERRGLQLGFSALLLSVGLFSLETYAALLANVFLLSLGMFAIHSLLSALVNVHASGDKPMVNGLYVAIYYAGGSVGSWLPSMLYGWIGWNMLLGLLALVGLAGYGFSLRIPEARHS